MRPHRLLDFLVKVLPNPPKKRMKAKVSLATSRLKVLACSATTVPLPRRSQRTTARTSQQASWRPRPPRSNLFSLPHCLAIMHRLPVPTCLVATRQLLLQLKECSPWELMVNRMIRSRRLLLPQVVASLEVDRPWEREVCSARVPRQPVPLVKELARLLPVVACLAPALPAETPTKAIVCSEAAASPVVA